LGFYNYEDFIFDAVLTILYAIEIVASFYKVKYEHKKAWWWVVHTYLLQNSLGYYVSAKNWQNWTISD